MNTSIKACIAGIYEHPLRVAPDHSVARLHADVAHGALRDAGLTANDVDAYFCAGDAPGLGPTSMIDYLGLQRIQMVQTTELGGASYLSHVGEAAAAVAAGRCKIALITLAGRPKSEGSSGTKPRNYGDTAMPCARCATCTNLEPHLSNWHGSRWRCLIMPNTTRTHCYAK